MSDIRLSIRQLEEPSKSIGEILIDFYETMKNLEKDGKKREQATKIVMTINDVERLFNDIRIRKEKRVFNSKGMPKLTIDVSKIPSKRT